MRALILPLALCAATVAGAQTSRQFIANTANPTLPFSSAVRAGDFIYVAGQIGDGPIDAKAKGDIRAQTRSTLAGIARILKDAGSSLANAASVTVYLRNVADAAAMNETYATFFPSNPPVRTTVVVSQPLAVPDGLIEISMIAIPNGGERTVIHPDGWAKSTSPYSYGIRSGNTLFLAGLVARNTTTNATITGDVTAQTKVVLDNGAAILKKAGMSFSDVVASRVYLTDASTFQTMNAAYRPYFGDTPPARVTVKTGLLSPDNAVEITMTAVKDPSRKAFTTPNADGTPGRANANLSSAVQVGNRLYVSGITGNTQLNRGDVKAQAAEILARVGRTLKAAGFSPGDIVDGTVFLADMSKFAGMNDVYRSWFGGSKFPARATVGIHPVGDDILLEIIFMAVK